MRKPILKMFITGVLMLLSMFAGSAIAASFARESPACVAFDNPVKLTDQSNKNESPLYKYSFCKGASGVLSQKYGTMTTEELSMVGIGMKQSFDYLTYCTNAMEFFDSLNVGQGQLLFAILGDALEKGILTIGEPPSQPENIWLRPVSFIVAGKTNPLNLFFLLSESRIIHKAGVNNTALDTFIGGLFTGNDEMVRRGLAGGQKIVDSMAVACGYEVSPQENAPGRQGKGLSAKAEGVPTFHQGRTG